MDEDKGRLLNARKIERSQCLGKLEIVRSRIAEVEHGIKSDEERARRVHAEVRRLEERALRTPALSLQAELCDAIEYNAKLLKAV